MGSWTVELVIIDSLRSSSPLKFGNGRDIIKFGLNQVRFCGCQLGLLGEKVCLCLVEKSLFRLQLLHRRQD